MAMTKEKGAEMRPLRRLLVVSCKLLLLLFLGILPAIAATSHVLPADPEAARSISSK